MTLFIKIKLCFRTVMHLVVNEVRFLSDGSGL